MIDIRRHVQLHPELLQGWKTSYYWRSLSTWLFRWSEVIIMVIHLIIRFLKIFHIPRMDSKYWFHIQVLDDWWKLHWVLLLGQAHREEGGDTGPCIFIIIVIMISMISIPHENSMCYFAKCCWFLYLPQLLTIIHNFFASRLRWPRRTSLKRRS